MEGREWAEEACIALRDGRTVEIRPNGRSLTGVVEDGELVRLVPCDPAEITVGDVVLARVRGHLIVLRMVLGVGPGRALIGNSAGREDGWVGFEDVFGRATRVEEEHRGC